MLCWVVRLTFESVAKNREVSTFLKVKANERLLFCSAVCVEEAGSHFLVKYIFKSIFTKIKSTEQHFIIAGPLK